MGPTEERLILQSPRSPSEWDAYFDLRWRILRQPWGQPRGSERDSEDDSAFHLLLVDAAGNPIVLNARDNAVAFYRKRGYDIIGDAETLFGVIRHLRMAKIVAITAKQSEYLRS